MIKAIETGLISMINTGRKSKPPKLITHLISAKVSGGIYSGIFKSHINSDYLDIHTNIFKKINNPALSIYLPGEFCLGNCNEISR